MSVNGNGDNIIELLTSTTKTLTHLGIWRKRDRRQQTMLFEAVYVAISAAHDVGWQHSFSLICLPIIILLNLLAPILNQRVASCD